MEKSWLEKFYTECGREVSLAYNVLNYSNNWGVTLGAAVLATGFMSAVKVDQSIVTILYPTTIHWFFVILSWIIMVRFFVRSALGLVNMYRWNELIKATSKVLSLSEDSTQRPIFERNLTKKIDTYFYRWKSPKRKSYIIWHNLKLMYFWFFLIVLGLFVWGVICLQHNLYYYLGLCVFAISTTVESIWFARWYGMQYEKIELEPEPDMPTLWHPTSIVLTTNDSRPIIFGFCNDGPYKHATSTLKNHALMWIPWSYHISSMDSCLTEDLSRGMGLAGRRVLFACWDSKFKGSVRSLRCGRIDHFIFANQILRVTIQLEDYSESETEQQILVKDPRILCLYS